MGRVYLDWNASAPVSDSARMAGLQVLDSLGDSLGNPSSVHAEGRAASRLVETARVAVAEAFGASGTVVFTSGATEAAALGLAKSSTNLGFKCARVEHDCVLAHCEPSLPVDSAGQVCHDTHDKSDTSENNLAIQAANSETGIIQDLPAHFAFCDAVQAFGKIPVRFDDLGADMAILSAHKFGGLTGAGALVLRAGLDVAPLLKGGGQEEGLRAGTQNLVGIAAMGAAATEAARQVKDGLWQEVAQKRDSLQEMLMNAAPDARIIGLAQNRLPNTLCIAAPNWEAALQVMQMDLAGFAISAGSACSSGKIKTSATLAALGLEDSLARCAIRLSIGPSTTTAELKSFATAWGKAYQSTKEKHAKNQKNNLAQRASQPA